MKKAAFVLPVLLLLGAALWLVKERTPSESGAQSPQSPVKATPATPMSGPREVSRATSDQTTADGEGTQAGPLPDLDRRSNRPAGGPLSAEKAAALARIQTEIPGVTVDFDPVTGAARWVASNRRLLTQAGGTDSDAAKVIGQFIGDNRALFGHGPELLDASRRVTDYTTDRSEARKIVWHQQRDGIDVFEAVFQANLTADLALINVGSQFVSPDAVPSGGEAPSVPVERAVVAAGLNVGEVVKPESVRASGPPADQADRHQQFRAAMLTDADAKLVWVPMNEAELRLAWDVTLTSRSRGEMYRVLVDAQNEEILVRHALTAYISDASYRVFTTESPTPYSPGDETPSSLQPLAVDRVMVTTSALDTTASPNGWINDGDNTTSGNNADAYTDTDADNSPDLPRTTGSPSRVFDFPLDLTQAPSNFKDASVTQLFYWTNFMHDRMYQLGFTEAAGNFQIDNFGRGGSGNDPVNAEAQDGSGTNNANFSTPVDGGRGRMQMFNWTPPTPDRDGSFEAEVVLHEYGHGVSNRLVGGPTMTISQASTRGMGEGWSDFYGLALTAEAADNPHGNWARGAWSRYFRSNWFSENYYYGARRYSYSTDMRKNPLTFKDIDPNQIDLHTDVPRNPTYSSTQDATQVHYQGTVWCVTLWDLRANLILKHGFAVGNERALFLVTEGMKLGPANPNFVESRDGIIQATMVSHPEDLGEVWSAFAKRGLGHGASAPASSTTVGIVESFTVPDDLEIDDRSGWNITGASGGPFTPVNQTLTLSNDGASPLNWSADTHAAWLSASPASGTLAPGASVAVTITTEATEELAGFQSTNLVFANTGTGFNQTVGVRLYVASPVVQEFSLDTNPGWTTEGEWAFGVPTGGGGSTGNVDPTAGATGANVFGVNLAGDVSPTIGGPHYLTMGPVDLSVHRKTRLQFQRWLNANSLTNSRVTVEVSADGATWREVFVNPGSATTDDAWLGMDYDISSIADQQSTVWIRWGYQNLTSSTVYSGWNIDDIRVLGEPTAFFELGFTSPVSEADGVQTGTITLNQPKAQPLTVQLASSDVTVATVPASVILPAGETTVNFDITPVDDSILDGAQMTLITASAPGVLAGQAELVVNDDETAVLTLSVPASLNEGDAGVSASVSVSEAPLLPVEVMLSSDDLSLVEAPASVMIPAGSTGPVAFTLNAPDNALAHGPRSAIVTAAVVGWTGDAGVITVVDDEAPQITLSGPASVRESVAPEGTFTVSVNTPLAVPLTIALASDDESELAVPPTVQIPAGSLSEEFAVTVVDDLDVDGPQLAEISASASGYAGAVLPVTVNDNDAAQFGISAIASPQKRNTPFIVRVTAQDTLGDPIPTFSGSPIWSSDSSTGPVAFTATVVNGFSGGAADYEIIVAETATGVELTVDDGSGHTGTSNAFDVVAVPLARFQWSGLPASAMIDGLVNATVTALDDEGNVAAGYESPTTLEVYSSSFDFNIGSSSTLNPTTPLVRNTAHEKSRVQMIYTAEEFGGAPQWLSQVNFYTAGTAGQTMSDFKVRVKLTDRSSFGSEGFDVGGWTTVYESVSQSASLVTFPFITPFFLDGTQNLMVDVSFSNTSTSTPGEVRVTPTQDPMVMYATGSVTDPDPLAWGNGAGPAPQTSLDRPTLVVYFAALIGELPSSPAPFAGGVWNGTVHNPVLTSAIFRARSPEGVASFSDRVGVISVGLVTTGSEIYFQDFESGAKPAEWTFSGTGTFRTQVTSSNTPRGSYHVTMDSSTNNSFARNEADLQINLAGRTDAMLEFYAREFADESHIPPPSPFTNGADFDGVAISPDGVQWAEVRSLRGINSSTHALYRVSLDPVMRRMGWSYGPNMRIRFNQYDNSVITSDGIAFDDVRLRVNNSNGLALDYGPNAVTEGSGSFDVTITAPSISASNRTVTLTCTQTAKLQVPATVLLPANQTSVVTQFTALDDPFVDGWKSVRVTAAMSGLTTTYHWVEVQDNDGPPVLELTVPATMAEGDPSATGTLKIIPPPATTSEVEITFSDSEQMTGSVGLTFSAGRESATFTVTPIDDTFLDGTQQVTVTARELLTNATGSAVIEILDNDTGSMTLALPASVQEGGAPGVGTVQLSSKSNTPATITLSSADPDQATVQPTVVVPVGQLTANFLITAVDDGTDDGTQTATIHASSVVYGAASGTLDVLDNDPTFFDISPVDSPQTRNAPFTVTVTAQDSSGATLTGFQGVAMLSAEAGGLAVPLEVLQEVRFVDGLWTGQVAVSVAAVGVTLTADVAGGAFGTSNPFDVQAGGSAVALSFSTVASPQVAGAAIPVSVSAVDANGVRVSEITGPVLVELATDPAGLVVTSTTLNFIDGRAQTTFCVPVAMASARLRGTAGALTGQSAVFSVSQVPFLIYPPEEMLFEDDFESGAFKPEWVITGTGNHRTEVTTANTPRTGSYHMVMDSSSGDARNEATLTLDLTGKQDVIMTFWMKEMGDEDHSPPTNPFTNGADFDGVAISADGTTWHEVQPLRSGVVSSAWQEFTLNLDQLAADSGIEFGPNFQIRLNHYDNFPAPTDGFAFDDIRIVANGLPQSEEPRLAVFEDDFESGVWKSEWTVTGTGNSRTEVTMLNTPRSGTYHMVMDANPALNSRNEATLTLDLTALEDVELRFWMKENLDEDHAPPTNPFTGGADFDGVAISEDGVTWYEVQGLRSPDTSSAYREFVVDMDAALQASGFAYNSSFKIRFNHYDNSPWTSGDGFAFDDISVTGRPEQQLALNAPATLAEGVEAHASVTLPAVRAVDTVVTLASNRPDCVNLPSTITIPAGNTVSEDFAITATEDDLLTGNLPLQIRATANGYHRGEVEVLILDNEGPVGFDLNLPASLAEGSSVSGSVSMSFANPFDLRVSLSASPATGLTLLPSIVLNAGTTSASFTLSKPENDMILEPASTTITADLGSASDTAAVSLTDNDAAVPLVITLPGSAVESSTPLSGSVGFAPPAVVGGELVVTLSSSDPASLTVPTTIIIPAGAGNAAFDATLVDNALSDGARSVTITAAAPGVSGDTHDINVLDDEVHHLAFDPISSPQTALVAFDVTVRAQTIDNQTVTAFTGTATLSAENSGGAVNMTPPATGAFINGVWTGPVTFETPASTVVIIADAGGGLTGSSDVFDVIPGPTLSITPTELNTTTLQGEPPLNQSLTLSNPGTGPLNWSAATLDSAPWFSLSPTSGVIPEGGSAPITATLTPGTLGTGAYTATLRFTSNDPAAPQQDVPVTFTLTTGVDHFEWSSIPSPQVANVPFAATITAKDSVGNTLTGFIGSAAAAFIGPATVVDSGTGTSNSTRPFWGSSYTKHRTQSIYLPAEVGPPGRLSQLSFNLYSTVTHSSVTVRLKHTAKSSYAGDGSDIWESAGWTTVYSGPFDVTTPGWNVISFSQPFDYDGMSNLMTDVSFDNASSSSGGNSAATTVSTTRVLYYGDTGAFGPPLNWSGSSPAGAVSSSIATVRFTSQPLVFASPSVLPFAGGTWTGDLSAQSSGTSLTAVATHAANAAATGISNPFDVISTGSLSLSIPAGGAEGGTLDAAVIASVAPTSDLTVQLATSDSAQAVPPASVTILAGQTSASFTLTLPDDTLLDGEQSVLISATAPGYDRGVASAFIDDNETTTVTLTLPATLGEGTSSTAGQASVQLAVTADAELVISLASSLVSRLTVPDFVTIPAGQSSAAFTLTAPNNSIIDGNHDAVVTATLAGSPPAAGTVQITDNESRALSLVVFTTTVREGGAPVPTAGYVTLSGTVTAPLQISLASSDTSELDVSTTVTVDTGSFSSDYFILTPVDDSDFDGSQSVTLTASAPTFTDVTRTVTVLDDDVHHFAISTIGSTQVRNQPFDVTFTAKDVNDVTIASYSGSPTLSAMDGATPLAVSPPSLDAFNSGVKTQSVTIGSFATGAVLSVTDGGTASNSNAFEVSFGSVSRFVWLPVASPQVVDASFPASIAAQDAVGNTVTSYAGSAALSISGYSVTQPVGSGTDPSYFVPFNTIFPKCRSQQVHLASEIGASNGWFTSLSINLTSVPAPVTLTDFTIRIKHTTRTGYSGTGDYIWETDGFTTVYQGSPSVSTVGLATFNFSTPFHYDGSSNLMVDYSYRAASSTTTRPSAAATHRGGGRVINYYTSSTGFGDPLTWSGTTPSAFPDGRITDIRLSWSNGGGPTTPPSTTPFVNGMWSGSLSVPIAGSPLKVTASDAAITGDSNDFEVFTIPFTVSPEPPYTGGLANSLSWNQPAAGLQYEVQGSVAADFAAPFSSGYLAGASHQFSGLTNGQTYYYRARVRRLGAFSWTGDWMPYISSTQDASPPVIVMSPETEKYTASAQTEISGTAVDAVSGVASVTVGGAAASTADGYANWTKLVSELAPGSNTVTIEAADNAVPPNTASVSYHIFRIEDATGQTNANGVPDLLNHALNLDAPGVGREGLPAAAMAENPGDGKTYLTLQYRRRINRAGFRYVVETSSTLAADGWDDTGASVEEIDVTPNPDGVTETCTVRITPAIGDVNAKFVRLRVEVD